MEKSAQKWQQDDSAQTDTEKTRSDLKSLNWEKPDDRIETSVYRISGGAVPADETVGGQDAASLLRQVQREVRQWPVPSDRAIPDEMAPVEPADVPPSEPGQASPAQNEPAQDEPAQDEPGEENPDELHFKPAARQRRPKITKSRLIKTGALLAIAIGLGWMPMYRLLELTSAEATVNARVVTLRSPIDGKLTFPDGPVQIGADVKAGERIADIKDSRADRDRLDDLQRETADLKIGVSTLKARIADLDAFTVKLKKQKDAFQAGRVAELEATAKQTQADIVAAQAKAAQTKAALSRAERLKAQGFQSDAAYDRAVRDQAVAHELVEALQHKLTATQVELKGAQDGLFVGDSYNDIPRTAQRLNEITQQLLDLRSQLGAKTAELALMQSELALEQKRFKALSSATITIPVKGRVWEVLTSNDEIVSRGQALFRVLDCGGAVVTASVSQSTYDALRIGQAATFHLRGSSVALPGKVVALNGMAGMKSNLAIGAGIFSREPYHVTVEVPALASKPNCYFGRSGKVTFDSSSGAPALK